MRKEEVNYKEEILKRGLKFSWVAKNIGVKQPAFSNYINGTRAMPESVMNDVCELIGIDTDKCISESKCD